MRFKPQYLQLQSQVPPRPNGTQLQQMIGNIMKSADVKSAIAKLR